MWCYPNYYTANPWNDTLWANPLHSFGFPYREGKGVANQHTLKTAKKHKEKTTRSTTQCKILHPEEIWRIFNHLNRFPYISTFSRPTLDLKPNMKQRPTSYAPGRCLPAPVALWIWTSAYCCLWPDPSGHVHHSHNYLIYGCFKLSSNGGLTSGFTTF